MTESLIYLERYRNEGTRTYSEFADYSEAVSIYRPDSNQESFRINVYELPREEMLVYISRPTASLENKYLGGGKAVFCIHPQILASCKEDPYVQRTQKLGTCKEGICVIPSSSTRTVYVQDSKIPHALKMHFPFQISRYSRKMRNEVIEQAINVSRELEHGIGLFDDRFSFLREVIGISHPNLNPGSPRGENWGYLVRDTQPFPPITEERALIPGFSLYGKDFFDPGQPPLLFDLVPGNDPVSFILEEILFPIIRHWIQGFLHFGYLLEPHGQNVLFEVKENRVIRIVHRDLSWGIDMRRRRDLGFNNENLNFYNRMETGEFASITYDKFMGGHFFDRIVQTCLEKYPKLRNRDFTAPCQEEFAACFPGYRDYLPGTVHYFSEKRDEFNKPLFRDTGQKPQWRP